MEQLMPVSMRDFGIDRLSDDDKIALALEIWDSLDEARPVQTLTPAESAELDRREAELDADPSKSLTWEQIRVSVESERQAEREAIP
jgi:putative addiction module component (TIGR02574 family)